MVKLILSPSLDLTLRSLDLYDCESTRVGWIKLYSWTKVNPFRGVAKEFPPCPGYNVTPTLQTQNCLSLLGVVQLRLQEVTTLYAGPPASLELK